MQPYPKSPFTLSELAQHYFQELQTVFSNAVSFEELFEPKKIQRPKNHSSSADTIDRVVKTAQFFELFKWTYIISIKYLFLIQHAFPASH